MNAEPRESLTVPSRRKFGILEIGQRQIGLDIDCLGEICVIANILPLLSPRRDVLGAIDLRGDMIPLIDPMSLCQVPPMEREPAIAAIIEHSGRAIALACDRAVTIAEFAAEEVKPLYANPTHVSVPVHSGVLTERRSINVLDAMRIFAVPDMPSCLVQETTVAKSTKSGSALAVLTFEAGGAMFGLDAVRIFGTVPRQKIENDTLTGGACLGRISYLGRLIPTLDATQVLGLGDHLREAQPEIVVLQFPNNQLLGLAVDVILQIRMVRRRELSVVPSFFGDEPTLFSAVLSNEGEQQIFMLDADVLSRREQLQSLAGLADRKTTTTTRAAPPVPLPDQAGDIEHTKARCLVFTAGVRMCCLITDVVSILSSPGTITPMGGFNPTIVGFFSHDGMAVPLLSLAHHLGHVPQHDPTETSNRRVLLAGPPERRVGFVVDHVDGIEKAEYLAPSDANLGISERIAKLRSQEFRAVVPYLDLDAISAAVELPRM
ncbi:MAG: chemotaxis protein CheW [Pseudomonadota bacterium]